MKITDQTILVTGGASGIGFALAEKFVREGNQVLVCGRRESALKEAKEKIPALVTRQCDLALPEDRESLYRWIATEYPDLSVLVNNAGIQQWMGVEDPDFYAKAKMEIAINIEAPLHLTSLFLKLGSLRTIMNVTSGLSFAPLAKVPVYSATKAFFHSFTLSLQKLVEEKNIEVIEIVPPALNTDLGGKGIHDFAPPVSGFIESIFSQLSEGRKQLTYQSSEIVSKAGQEVLGPVFERMNAAR